LTDKKKNKKKKTGEGQVVGLFVPKDGVDPKDSVNGVKASAEEIQAFTQAFFDTIGHKGQGLLTRYLFHEPPQDKTTKTEAAADSKKPTGASEIFDTLQKRFGRILYGGLAWDAHIEHSKSYDLINSDLNALEYAIENHMVTTLPHSLHVIEYGPGGNSGVTKPQKLIEAILKSDEHKISRYTAIDILSRYANEAALSVHDKFNLHAEAIACDFMAAQKIKMPTKENCTPLALIFGGTLANAPDNSAQGGMSSTDNASAYLARMNKQHGIGSYIMITYDAENNPETLLKEYQTTDEFGAFVLSAFTRAVGESIITDDTYDPFRYWKMQPHYDETAKAVRLRAICREDHVISTIRGPISIKKDESLTSILSYKWDESDYKPMFEKAGYEITGSYRKDGAHHGIILAKAVHHPTL